MTVSEEPKEFKIISEQIGSRFDDDVDIYQSFDHQYFKEEI